MMDKEPHRTRVHALEALERNLGSGASQSADLTTPQGELETLAGEGFAVISGSGFAVISGSGFAIA